MKALKPIAKTNDGGLLRCPLNNTIAYYLNLEFVGLDSTQLRYTIKHL